MARSSIKKITLDEGAASALSDMCQELRKEQPHIKLRPSGLCSWIISRYFEQYYPKEKKTIAEAHFNPKEYLRIILKSKDQQMMLEDLQNIIEKIRKGQTKKRKKNQPPPHQVEKKS